MKTEGAKRIASRYVKALFDVAMGASALDAVAEDMAAVHHLLEENEDFRQFLANPLLTRKAQAEIMGSLLVKLKANQVTQRFLAMLAQNRRLPVLPEIIALFAEAVQAAHDEMTAEVVAATALKPMQIKSISQNLSKAYGKKVNLNVSRDPSLLGGMMIKVGSLQIDGSMAGKLNRLEQKLKAA